jgi:hypothetical protein
MLKGGCCKTGEVAEADGHGGVQCRSTCPPPSLIKKCSGARAASAGNCFVCAAQWNALDISSVDKKQCIDQFCLGDDATQAQLHRAHVAATHAVAVLPQQVGGCENVHELVDRIEQASEACCESARACIGGRPRHCSVACAGAMRLLTPESCAAKVAQIGGQVQRALVEVAAACSHGVA